MRITTPVAPGSPPPSARPHALMAVDPARRPGASEPGQRMAEPDREPEPHPACHQRSDPEPERWSTAASHAMNDA